MGNNWLLVLMGILLLHHGSQPSSATTTIPPGAAQTTMTRPKPTTGDLITPQRQQTTVPVASEQQTDSDDSTDTSLGSQATVSQRPKTSIQPTTVRHPTPAGSKTTVQPPTTDRQTTIAVETTNKQTTIAVQTTNKQTTISATTSPPIPCPVECVCTPNQNNGIDVDCRERGLQNVPTGLPESTTSLFLDKNRIAILNENIFASVPNLEYLYLRSSNIQILNAGAFTGLTKLKYLDLSANSISSVSHVFTGLTSLNTLDLSSNLLQTLPNTAFDGLTNLQTLTLFGNEIQTITPGTFDSNTNLINLFMGNNNISSLNEYMFRNLVKLERLALDYNHLSTIAALVFQDLKSLHTLSLNFMQISTITNAAFEGLDNLVLLSLANNNLESLAVDVLIPLPNLTSLILNTNPWRCDCNMKQLRDYLNSKQSISFTPSRVICASPPHVKDVALATVKDQSFACEPFITQNPRDKQVTEGEGVEFSCSVLGDPQPDIHWETPQGVFNSSSPPGRVHVDAQTGYLKLIVDEVQSGDSGLYTCVAKNSRGMDVDQATLNVYIPQPPEGSVTCPPVSPPVQCIQPELNVQKRKVEEKIVDISWTPSTDNDVTMYIVSTAKFGSPPIFIKEEFVTDLTTSTYVFNGLESKTTYILCVTPQISGCDSTSTIDNCLFVTTLGPDPCVPLPITVAINEITETEIDMRWTPSSDRDAIGFIAKVTKFGEEDNYSAKVTNLTQTSYKFTNLKAGTNYVACVTARLQTCPMITDVEQCKYVTTMGVVSPDSGIDELKRKHTFEIIGVFFATCIGTLLVLASIFVIWWRYKKPPSLKKYEFHKETKKHRSGQDEAAAPITLSEVITSQISDGATASYFPHDGGYVNEASVFDDGDEIRPYQPTQTKSKSKNRSKGKSRPEPVGEEDQDGGVITIEHVAEVYTANDSKDPAVELSQIDDSKVDYKPDKPPANGELTKNKRNKSKSRDDKLTNGQPVTDVEISVL